MIKRWYYIISFVLLLTSLSAQETESLYKTTRWTVDTDTLRLDTQSLNSTFFEIRKPDGTPIAADQYLVDYQEFLVYFKTPRSRKDTLQVNYLIFPEFLTRTHIFYEPERIVSNQAGIQVLEHKQEKTTNFKPFEGLQTSGSLTRGITMGTNQNLVTNSNLDLQITGKLSENVNLRASLQDSNALLQNGGYSQKIDEFDQIFIELYSDSWSLRAGDLFLENRASSFLNFNKKVQGLSTKFTIENQTSQTIIETAGALAKGQYAKSTLQALNGIQGPYKLKGPNGELFILLISGSETVYVNGAVLKRGEDQDYIIDYNSGEIRFTTQFPITEDMRIVVEYQYTDRNYTRFVGYQNIQHKREKWSIGGAFYIESDLKNQPLQQSLTPEQIQILKQAGNDPDKMIADSAYLDSYSENKIMYKKILTPGGTTYFIYSNDSSEQLYTVSFQLVGTNNGDYIMENNQTNGKIFKYTPAINGLKQGNYDPIIPLIAPQRNAIVNLNASYNPSEKTELRVDWALSNNDQNLFSTIDDDNNQGWAADIQAKQQVWKKNQTQVEVFTQFKYIDQRFKSLENLYSIEFDRDWNLQYHQGDQSLLIAGISFTSKPFSNLSYQLENLSFGPHFKGTRHKIYGNLQTQRWFFKTDNSFLRANSLEQNTTFNRLELQGKYHLQNNWIGNTIRYERQDQEDSFTSLPNVLNHQFLEFNSFIGKGDSLGVYAEIGWIHRINDSIKNHALAKNSTINTLYLKSTLIKNQRRELDFYINHRTINYTSKEMNKEQSFNSKITYNDQYLNGLIQSSTSYESSSGTIAQQEFTYLEVEPGQGQYMWIDYNQNGIQELEEFEIAAFPDQAIFVRLYLPNQVFVQTHLNKFSQSFTLNPLQWSNQSGLRKILSNFYNQTYFLIDRNDFKTNNNLNFNPFKKHDENLAGLNQNFRNSLFYNRGKQRHSVTYTYLKSKVKNLLSYGSQENELTSQQVLYNHLIQKSWLISLSTKLTNQKTHSQSYQSKNYQIKSNSLSPRISYLFNNNTSVDFFFELQNKENLTSNTESLTQQRLGIEFQHNSKRNASIQGEFSLYNNKFIGDSYSPVAYQMLEGLQVGKNMTWRLLLQKNLTSYLDLSLNYSGRASQETHTIHTGSVQLRAFF